MSFDETTTDDFGESPLPEESNNNRTFMIAVGILGGIILISVACLGAVYLFSQNRAASQQEVAISAATQTAAAAELTVFPTTTALANGGFADDYGLPGLVVMALAFVVVILFARRLRNTPETNR